MLMLYIFINIYIMLYTDYVQILGKHLSSQGFLCTRKYGFVGKKTYEINPDL
jgi:hypothetical protein